MTLAVRVLSAGILTAGALLLPAAPAAAGQFHPTDAVDDFNCDGIHDEVYLADHYDVGDARAAGAIIVYLSTFEDVTLSQNTPGIPGTPETGDRFGATYASADFNGDGCDELIVGAPGEDRRAGMVVVIEGSPTGPDPSRAIAYTQDSPGVPGSSERGDEFGATLAAGATTSGQAYLLAGSPGEAIGSRTDAGSVYYLRGGTWRTFHQDSPGVAGTAEYGDRFGDTLASGDRHFVVGAPAENLSGRDYAGQIHVFDHRIVGGIPDPLATISQDSAGVSGTPEVDDGFGRDVSVVSYRPSAGAAIGALVAVGVPGEDLGADDNAGMAHVLAVTPTGKVTELSDINQDTAGVPDSTQRDDVFGQAVALAVTGTDTTATPATALLAVGVPGEAIGDDRYGALHVFRNLRSPGDRDIWRPNSADRSDLFWNLDATATELITGAYDGNTGTYITWTDILEG